MSEPLPGNLGDADWQNNVNNWRDEDATWIQERSIVRVAGTPVVASASPVPTGQVANVNAGRVFYDSTNNKLILSLGSSNYKNILASNNLNPTIDSSTDVVLKVTGASYGITLKPGGGSIVLDKINTLTVDTTGSNSATVTTTANVDSASTVEISAPIKVASGTTILRGASVASTAVTATGAITGGTLVSTVGNGTAPITVNSGTVVTNLNASFLEGASKSSLLDLTNSTGTLNIANKVNGLLSVANGGTGAAITPAVGGIVYGYSTSAYGVTSAGTTGQVITSAGAAAPTWQYPDLFTCTSSTRPSSPDVGQAIYEKDTGSFLVYYGATTGWKPPWTQPWGVQGVSTLSADLSIASTSVTDLTGLSISTNLVSNRYYRATLSMYITGNASISNRFTSLILTNGANSTQFASFAPQYVAVLDNMAYCSTATFTSSTINSVVLKIRYALNGTASITVKGGTGNSSVSELVVEDLGPSSTVPSA